ncbi:MAG TPA: aspartate aminotransferase family protein [Caulobacteraceae bacterium]|nr:aspartate aminotransferase family protein [Caulobacteraceae bacterium]
MAADPIDIIRRNERFIPGGTASSARYLPEPIVFARAEGSRLWDVTGRSYVDLNCAFGAILLGHRDRRHLDRVAELTEGIDLIGLGTTEIEGRLAEQLCDLIPCAEQVAYCCSGTEATFHAIRVARAATGRQLVVKFEGAYHGWHDYVALNFLSPADQIGRPAPITAGALASSLAATLVLPYNDAEAVEDLVRRRGGDIAAILVEPQMHNVGAIQEDADFFRTLRRLTDERGIVLIFDEVVTGFRHALGGYQSICGVTPDLATFGKALGNGLPISLIAGRRDLMRRFAPRQMGGDVLLGGTYNGHPSSVAAGLAVIEVMQTPGRYERLFALGDAMRAALTRAAQRSGSAMQVVGFGSVNAVHFAPAGPRRYEDLVGNDSELDSAFRLGLIERGFACSPTPLRRFHVSLAHDESDIESLGAAAEEVLRGVGERRAQAHRRKAPATASSVT